MEKGKGRKQFEADMMLLLVTLCWGVSYLAMDICLTELTPFMVNSFRFLGSFILLCIFFFKKVRTINKITFKYAFLASISMIFVYIGATYGVLYTTISNSGFLCNLTVIFTPIIAFVVFKTKPDKRILFGLILTVVGILLLTKTDDFSLKTEHLKGDLLCMFCGFSYAINLLTIEAGVKKKEVDAFNLGTFELGFVGVYFTILASVTNQLAVPSTTRVWVLISFLAIFCTGLAFVIQPIAQQHTTATHVGIIFCMEPVFSSIVAAIFAHEILAPINYLGAVLMLAAVVITEVVPVKSTSDEQLPEGSAADTAVQELYLKETTINDKQKEQL